MLTTCLGSPAHPPGHTLTQLPHSRCPACRQAVTAITGSRRKGNYDRYWQTLSKMAIAQHGKCADCGTTKDLTGEHKTWPALTLADIEVLCRSCNSKRGPKRRLLT